MRKASRVVVWVCWSALALAACEDDPMDDDYLYEKDASAGTGAGTGTAGSDGGAAGSGGSSDDAGSSDAGSDDAG